mmetsp:Transcript_11290/g.47206  ORF Transcript_11290/g.47206 Transcript_11290/m.47206 type:complete len:516 (+) Transcript_11290:977-2524(+)
MKPSDGVRPRRLDHPVAERVRGKKPARVRAGHAARSRHRQQPLQRAHLLQEHVALPLRHHRRGMHGDGFSAHARALHLRRLQLPAEVLRRRDGQRHDARLERVELTRERAELVVGAEVEQGSYTFSLVGRGRVRLPSAAGAAAGDAVGTPVAAGGGGVVPIASGAVPLGLGGRPRKTRGFRGEPRLDPLPLLVRSLKRLAVGTDGGELAIGVPVPVGGGRAVPFAVARPALVPLVTGDVRVTGGRWIVSGTGGNQAAHPVNRVVVEDERERTLLPDGSEGNRTVDLEVPVRHVHVRPSRAAVAPEPPQEPRDRSGARRGVEVGVEVERLFATGAPLWLQPRRTPSALLTLAGLAAGGARERQPEGFSRAHAVESILGSLPDALLVRCPGRRQRPAVRRRLFRGDENGDVLAKRDQVVPVHRRGGVVEKLDVSPAVRVARGDRPRLRSLRRVGPDDDPRPPPVPLDPAPHVRTRMGPVGREQRHHTRGLTRVGKRVRVELGRAGPPRWDAKLGRLL